MTDELVVTAIVTLLGLAFFLSIIDVAFHYLRRTAIRAAAEESWKAQFLRDALDDPNSLLVPLRIGIQASFIGTTILATELYLHWRLPHPLLAAFGTMILTFAVLRELLPNVIGRKNPERVLLALLTPYRLYESVVRPASRPLMALLRKLVPERVETEEEVSEEEVQAFIEHGEEEGIFEGDEGRMVLSIVDLGDKIVREIMTPRPEMVAIRREATLGDLRQVFVEEKYSRIPVYEEDLDHIVGIVYALDVIEFMDATPDSPIDPLIREVHFVPETKKVSALLREFQKNRSTFAIVVDEYGGTSGLVTVEDIVEEIVGEIHDEFDEVEKDIVKEKDGVYLVSGRAEIDEVEEELGIELDGEGFETVSGFVLNAMGRVPQRGEVIEVDGMRIEVVEAEGHRIDRVRIRLLEERRPA